jgi:CRP-like cAMP-binding protein
MPRVPSAEPDGNRLLSRFPREVTQRLRKRMQRVNLDVRQVLYEAQGPIKYAYFPIDCMLSAVMVMRNGGMIEVATIGLEGAVGLPPALEAESSPNRVFAQIAGEAHRLDVKTLREEAAQDRELAKVLALYQAAFLMQVSQSVACNGLHSVQQRCCRWLLMTHDRLPSDDMPLTHEFLAIMLGVRRAGVSEVLKSLQDEGLIRYGRGKIRVMSRRGLESRSCECYENVKNEYRRLLG